VKTEEDAAPETFCFDGAGGSGDCGGGHCHLVHPFA